MTRQLTVKAATRLRRYELYARRLSLQVRSVDKRRWAREQAFAPTQDDFAFLKALETIWQSMILDMGNVPLFKVSISLYDPYKREDITLDLFETGAPKSSTALTESMDAINKRYGSQTVSVGTCPHTSAGFVGTKIAFTRVPEKAEFNG